MQIPLSHRTLQIFNLNFELRIYIDCVVSSAENVVMSNSL